MRPHLETICKPRINGPFVGKSTGKSTGPRRKCVGDQFALLEAEASEGSRAWGKHRGPRRHVSDVSRAMVTVMISMRMPVVMVERLGFGSEVNRLYKYQQWRRKKDELERRETSTS